MNSEITLSRRDLLKFTGASIAARSFPDKNVANAQVPESSDNESWKELPSFQAGFIYLEYGFKDQGKDLDVYKKDTGKVLDRLVLDGANSVAYDFPIFMNGWTGSRLYTDPELTPSDEVITAFTNEAQKRNLTVMLRPKIDETSIINDQTPTNVYKWRGSIQPVDIDSFFQSKTELMRHYASLAQKLHIPLLSVGVEENSLEWYSNKWKSLIENVKDEYDGTVMYALNWGRYLYEEGYNFEMLREFDQLGIDAFYPLNARSGSSQEELVNAWQTSLLESELIKRTLPDMKLVFSESGMPSVPAGWEAPFYYPGPDAPVNQEDQATYMQSTCDVIGHTDHTSSVSLDGMYVWVVGRNSLQVDETRDTTHDPINKKAEESIQSCYKRS